MQQQPANRQVIADRLDPARARALQAMLGQEPTITSGDALPPFAHQIYFWDPQGPAKLGRDGHPRIGGLIPDMGLPRRMWAAGRMVFHAPLLAGIAAERTTRVEAAVRKTGRSGPLAFVTLRHDIRQRSALVLSEWQELVYRSDPDGAAPPQTEPTPTDESIARQQSFDSTLLFRYSALTFNGHRIHYDQAYARETEGYDDLVVHGPLLAHLLMGLARAELGRLTAFDYRARAPVMVSETVDLCWRADGAMWVRGADGRMCMQARASG